MKSVKDPRFDIRDSKPAMGKGLFARAPIKRGELVLEYTGKKIPTSVANASPSRYLFEIDKRWTIDGPVPENLAGYINHGCDPNCESTIEGGRVLIYAIKDIKKSEELSFDYGQEYFDEFIKPVGCRCGAAKHRR